jgi:hypothetical protein
MKGCPNVKVPESIVTKGGSDLGGGMWDLTND